MIRRVLQQAVGVLVASLAPVAAAQSQATSEKPEASVKDTVAPSGEVVVTVNGHPITRAGLEKRFLNMARDRYDGKLLTDAELKPLRRKYWPEYIRTAINRWLMNHEIPEAFPAVTDSELIAVLDMELGFSIADSGSTREEFDTGFRDRSGVTLYELLSWRRTNPFYKEGIRQKRWIATKFPDAVKVTDEEVNDVFKRKWADRTRPAQVRVSHILIAADSESAESKALARKKMEGVQAEARKPGADFAVLVRKHSTCSSASKGGDLGLIYRHGSAHDAFAEAAFALEMGKISAVVETPDGYHIIKLTERIEPRAVSLPLVEDLIRTCLRTRKIRRILREYRSKLFSSATIVYVDEQSKPGSKRSK